ncbi:hypothetical protein L345_16508, partial [Ophiophagus hannah]
MVEGLLLEQGDGLEDLQVPIQLYSDPEEIKYKQEFTGLSYIIPLDQVEYILEADETTGTFIWQTLTGLFYSKVATSATRSTFSVWRFGENTREASLHPPQRRSGTWEWNSQPGGMKRSLSCQTELALFSNSCSLILGGKKGRERKGREGGRQEERQRRKKRKEGRKINKGKEGKKKEKEKKKGGEKKRNIERKREKEGREREGGKKKKKEREGGRGREQEKERKKERK